MIEPAVFIREPLKFKQGVYVYPPSVKEVITNNFFGKLVDILTLSYEDIQDEMAKKEQYTNVPTPFEFLLINCYHSPQFLSLTKQAFQFFTHKDITIFYEQKKIVLGDLEEMVQSINSLDELIVLEEEEFFNFQNMVRQVVGKNTIKPPEPPNPNEDPRITRIKAKARERDRIKARKGTSGGISFITSLTAICCMGVGITPLNIGEMSYAAISPMMKMLQNKEKYEVDIRSLLAGADSKKVKPKYWIRNSD